jgi:hypothetical protein
LESRICALQKENEALLIRLNEGKSSSETRSKADLNKIDKMLEQQISHWGKRKRSAVDLVNMMSEGRGVSVSCLYEEIGLERDEDYKCSIIEARRLLEPPEKKRKV